MGQDSIFVIPIILNPNTNMKYSTMLASAIMMTTLLLSCTKDVPVGSQDDTLNYVEVNAIEDPLLTSETMEAINAHRHELGLTSLSLHSVIKKEASEHTDYMIFKDEANHDYFYEREAYLKKELNAIVVGENVAYAYNSADAVLRAWLEDEERRSNVEGDFNYFGISVKKNAEGRLFFTSIFVKQ